jgi:hypothetical protein
MMPYVLSRYNHHVSWVLDYANPEEITIYDRSENPLEGSIVAPNVGSDWYDKLTWIIDNYNNLPDVVLLAKANMFDYITPREFERIRFNDTLTPILTQNHKTYSDEQGVVCFYENGLYYERNDGWYLSSHPARSTELFFLLGMSGKDYIPFAPGSGYIVPKENILKYSKKFYEKLRAYLEWTIYPGEAQIMERGAYCLWQ